MNDLVIQMNAVLVQLEQRLQTARSEAQRIGFMRAIRHLKSARLYVQMGFGDSMPALRLELQDLDLCIKEAQAA